MIDWINLLQSLGFPVFVTLWFMFRLEKILNQVTLSMNSLRVMIETNCDVIRRNNK